MYLGESAAASSISCAKAGCRVIFLAVHLPFLCWLQWAMGYTMKFGLFSWEPDGTADRYRGALFKKTLNISTYQAKLYPNQTHPHPARLHHFHFSWLQKICVLPLQHFPSFFLLFHFYYCKIYVCCSNFFPLSYFSMGRVLKPGAKALINLYQNLPKSIQVRTCCTVWRAFLLRPALRYNQDSSCTYEIISLWRLIAAVW